MNDIEAILRILIVLGVPFLLGVSLGVEIVKRRNASLANDYERLGRTVNDLIDQTTNPLRFTGSGFRVTRQLTVNLNGTECQLTFEAKS